MFARSCLSPRVRAVRWDRDVRGDVRSTPGVVLQRIEQGPRIGHACDDRARDGGRLQNLA